MATTELERLVVRLVGDATSYQAMLRKAEASARTTASRIQALGKRIEGIGMSFRRFGRTMSMFVTAPLLIIGGLATQAFAQFDKAMIESTSIMQVTAEQTRAMRDAALELSTKAVQGPKDLAESYFFLASAGKNAEQSMALLPQVAKFATAGAFDMALATDLLTDAQSALGLSSKNVAQDTENMARVADVLVKANTLANASVQQFSVSLTTKSGAALKAYNKDVEEGVAVLAALADQGVKAQLSGNALDRIIRLSTKGALENAKAHAELGFRVFDEAGQMRNLGDIIANLEDVLEGMSDKQRAAALDALGFEARVQGVILPLLGTSKAIARYEKELRKAQGITEEVAEKQLKSFSNQMKILKNQVTIVGIEIGEILAPMIADLSERIKEGVKWWRALTPEVKKARVQMALWFAVIGPGALLLGGLLGTVGFLIKGIGVLVGVIKVATAWTWAWNAALWANPLIGIPALIIGGLVAVGAAIVWLNRRQKAATEAARAAESEALKSKAAERLERQTKLMTELRKSTEGVVDIQEKLTQNIGETKAAMEDLAAEADRLIERYKPAQQVFDETEAKLRELFSATLIDQRVFDLAIKDARDQLKEGLEKELEIKINARLVGEVQGISSKSLEGMAILRQAAERAAEAQATRRVFPFVDPFGGMPTPRLPADFNLLSEPELTVQPVPVEVVAAVPNGGGPSEQEKLLRQLVDLELEKRRRRLALEIEGAELN